ncbi:MAG: hypothetical protein AAF447_23155, partial [Myxococcota bacterium]
GPNDHGFSDELANVPTRGVADVRREASGGESGGGESGGGESDWMAAPPDAQVTAAVQSLGNPTPAGPDDERVPMDDAPSPDANILEQF